MGNRIFRHRHRARVTPISEASRTDKSHDTRVRALGGDIVPGAHHRLPRFRSARRHRVGQAPVERPHAGSVVQARGEGALDREVIRG